MAAGWDGTSKTVVVTGANTGIGKETSRVLAARGAEVIMACRDLGRAEEAASDIRKSVPHAKLRVMQLDMGSLASVRRFSAEFTASKLPLHILILNAGIMATPFQRTVDGFESQFGTVRGSISMALSGRESPFKFSLHNGQRPLNVALVLRHPLLRV